MPKCKDLIGRQFGRLKVIKENGFQGRNRHLWCRCICGTEKSIAACAIKSGSTISCGCYKKETGGTHRLSKTKFYKRWQQMIRRCYKSQDKKYSSYGGRGIRVCEFFRSSPANLILCLGKKPEGKFSIGRANNDGHYSCGQCAECLRCGHPMNVRWETDTQQARNKRGTKFWTFQGVQKPISQWSEELKVPYKTMWKRLARNADPLTGKKL